MDAVRRHGEHLERVVLAGVEGPDRALQMPLVLDFALRRLSDLAATSPSSRGEFPDTYHEFRQVLDQADREPLVVRVQGERTKHAVEVRVRAFLLQFAIKDMLPNGARPAAYRL